MKLYLYVSSFKHPNFDIVALLLMFDVCRPLCNGQRGEVYEVNGEKVAVILDISSDNRAKEERDEKSTEESASPPVYWLNGIYFMSVGIIFLGFQIHFLSFPFIMFKVFLMLLLPQYFLLLKLSLLIAFLSKTWMFSTISCQLYQPHINNVCYRSDVGL